MKNSGKVFDETVTIKVEGNGPIGRILVDADAHGHVRAYAENPRVHFEYNDMRLNAKATIGNEGFINVIKDLKLKDRIYKCEMCGLIIDRDYNASINLANYKSA